MPMRLATLAVLSLGLLGAACSGPPPVADHPTWAEVEPILRGQCNHCHGATASSTGAALSGSAVYRLDFFDMGDGACGDAALAMNPLPAARVSASLIRESVASINGNRPRMPPAPAPLLTDWERETIDRWTRTLPLAKGSPPWTNRMPRLQVFNFPKSADATARFSVILSDPDGDPVVGVLKAAEDVIPLDRPGSFAVSLDTSRWPAGLQTVTAVLCDGWGNTTFELGQVEIGHGR
jgi:hypothetical protein